MVISSIYRFLFIYLIRFVIVMRGDDWFYVWLGLEINIISYIIIIYRRFNLISIERCLRYFFIQRIGSAILLMGFYLYKNILRTFVLLILSYKMGAGPFFFWFPPICIGLDWISCLLLMTIQKFIPFIIIRIFVYKVLWIIIFTRLLFGAFGSFNQRYIKQLFAYSSIHHLGWIILMLICGDLYWIVYLFLYRIILIGLLYLFIDFNVIRLNIVKLVSRKWWFIMGIIRIAGIPPLLGFFLKLIVLNFILNINFIYIFFIIFISVLILYVYIRIVYDLIMIWVESEGYINYNLNLYTLKYDIYQTIGYIIGLFSIVYILYYNIKIIILLAFKVKSSYVNLQFTIVWLNN